MAFMLGLMGLSGIWVLIRGLNFGGCELFLYNFGDIIQLFPKKSLISLF